MTVAECAVGPDEIAYRLAGRQVERSLGSKILRIDSGVFGVDVADGIPERSNNCQRVHSLEEEVTWIEVHCGNRSDGSAQAHKRRRVVYAVRRMQLKAELAHSIVRGELG